MLSVALAILKLQELLLLLIGSALLSVGIGNLTTPLPYELDIARVVAGASNIVGGGSASAMDYTSTESLSLFVIVIIVSVVVIAGHHALVASSPCHL